MIAILLALCFFLQAQTNPARQDDSTSSSDYVVGPADVLSIHVFGLKELDQEARVSNSGKIHVPFIGIIKVNDLTLHQIETIIAAALVERDLVKDPWVQVHVLEYRAHPAYVIGEIQQTGQFMITRHMDLRELITLSGGFNEVSTQVGYLYRIKDPKTYFSGNPEDPQENNQEVLRINFAELFDGSHPELNVTVRSGDVLYVPQRKPNYFYIVGDVLQPGAFEIASSEPLLATQAISRAGGPLRTAKISKGILMRYDQEGTREELPVDFQAILQGRKPNFPVLPNDIIFIPGSSAKTLGYGLLGIIPGVAQGIAVIR